MDPRSRMGTGTEEKDSDDLESEEGVLGVGPVCSFLPLRAPGHVHPLELSIETVRDSVVRIGRAV